MASAPGPNPSGASPGAAVTPTIALLLALCGACGACGDDAVKATQAGPAVVTERAPAADPAAGMTTVLDGASPAFGAAVMAELTGDDAAARTGFEKVLGAGDVPAPVKARAALHLASIEARAGQRRHALDYVVRAATLAPSDIVVAEGVAQLQAEDVAHARDIRGPQLGTPLVGVDARVAERFAAAERAYAAVHDLHPRPVIEALSSSIRLKEDATEDVAAKYRAVAAAGGLALVASDYRIGSLYHDLALGLLFELPPELDPGVAAGLRRTLRVRAIAYLHKAVDAYRECLKQTVDSGNLWRSFAETDVRAADALLAAAGEGTAP